MTWLTDERLHVRDSPWPACKQWVTAALGVVSRGGAGDFDAKLVRPMSLDFADAFDLPRVQGIDFRSALMALARAPQ
ncbi:hypothetical protein [Nitrobacter hamburgensis]|uniref:hypothetical protein n=1 Tax=Nitrobacter hamburgensis TaxID=912 RepID=UPI0018DC0680|nr:hypothetical protein [Nitrobacter hamburgensis]